MCGLMFASRPDEDERLKKTVPENPPISVTVIVENPVDPAGIVTCVGLAEIAKSCFAGPVTVTPTWKEWVMLIAELVPVTVTM